MFELALAYKEAPITLKQVSENQKISEKYLSKLIIPLKGIGLVQSLRGAHGGYKLNKSPDEITLLEIIEILEGNIAPVECIKSLDTCDMEKVCPTREIWFQLEEVIVNFLKNITLENIVQRYKKNENIRMYYI